MKIHGVWKEDAKTPSLLRWIYPIFSLPPSRNNTLKAQRRSSPLFPTSPLFHLSFPVSTSKWENTYINTPRCKVEHCHQEPWSLLSIPRGKSKHLLSIQTFHGKPSHSYLFTPKRFMCQITGGLGGWEGYSVQFLFFVNIVQSWTSGCCDVLREEFAGTLRQVEVLLYKASPVWKSFSYTVYYIFSHGRSKNMFYTI